MKVFGVVAEYNPFHNGHAFHLNMTRSLGADAVVAVMSGNFVQRGDCSVMPQRAKTLAALRGGVSLVLSLPLPACVSGAERFAYSAIDILDALNIVDTISFGSESGNAKLLGQCAEILCGGTLDEAIMQELKCGCTYAAARQNAVKKAYGEEISGLLSCSNDVLGVEYIKSLIKLDSKMGYVPVTREGAKHDRISTGRYKSASQIRSEIYGGEDISGSVPETTMDIIKTLRDGGKMPPDKSKLEAAMLSELRRKTTDELKLLPDISEGLENRLYQAVRKSATIEEVLNNTKSKRYTHARLRRILLCAYLGITEEFVREPIPYIRVLGFDETGQKLLSEISSASRIPIITKPSQISSLSDYAKRLFELECTATDLYSLLLPSADECGREMTDGLIKI